MTLGMDTLSDIKIYSFSKFHREHSQDYESYAFLCCSHTAFVKVRFNLLNHYVTTCDCDLVYEFATCITILFLIYKGCLKLRQNGKSSIWIC